MNCAIDIDELKKLQFEILKYVAAFCENHHINYWLTAGTLLGAVRHQGYIPWDDDIDIGMKREDYTIFTQQFNHGDNKRYSFHCLENDKNYLYPMGKVLDNATVLYEPNKEYGYQIAVYIDVFVYDHIPSDPSIVKKLYRQRDFYLRMRYLRDAREHSGSYLRKKLVHAVSLCLKVFPTIFIAKRIAAIGKKYREDETGFYGDLVGEHRVIIDAAILSSFVKLKFEDGEYLVPADYDKWLTLFFGNYMQLPPEEQRVSHHNFEVFYIE